MGHPFHLSKEFSNGSATCPRRFGPASTYDMGNCLLSDTNTLDMDDLSDLIPTYSASSSSSSSSPHPSFGGGGRGGAEWDVFNMRPGSRDPIL